jgi:uncharacterized protein YbaR (Trm112 family)
MHRMKTDILLCPQCSGVLQFGPAGSERLDCQNCPLSYPIRVGIPVMVIQQASARATNTDADFERKLSEAFQAPFSGWSPRSPSVRERCSACCAVAGPS